MLFMTQGSAADCMENQRRLAEIPVTDPPPDPLDARRCEYVQALRVRVFQCMEGKVAVRPPPERCIDMIAKGGTSREDVLRLLDPANRR